MRSLLDSAHLGVAFLPAALLVGCVDSLPVAATPSPAVVALEAGRELDDFHAAAAVADEARYFAHFAPDAVFLGTDPSERWRVVEFRAYAHAHFAKGKGWTYEPGRRAISSSPDGDVVWFDEDLKNAHLGLARGTGVLVRKNGRLLIAQYNLTVPIPNEKMDDVVHLVDVGSHAAPPVSLEALYKRAYESATMHAGFDPLDEAAKALLGAMPEAKKHPEVDTEFWLHNELTWVRWQQGDLPRALAEVDAAGVTIDHGTLPDAKRTALRLHEYWDRAYLLLEAAMATPIMPIAKHAEAMQAAQTAKAAYDTLATANNDGDGMAVLEAFFLLNTGGGKEAAAAARRVDVDKDEDLQDLYVIARAFDANGEHAAADAVVARICAGNTYLMKPLIVQQLAREGRKCPAR
jgi:hypothetical protein